jgi:hypothetical protein
MGSGVAWPEWHGDRIIYVGAGLMGRFTGRIRPRGYGLKCVCVCPLKHAKAARWCLQAVCMHASNKSVRKQGCVCKCARSRSLCSSRINISVSSEVRVRTRDTRFTHTFPTLPSPFACLTLSFHDSSQHTLDAEAQA